MFGRWDLVPETFLELVIGQMTTLRDVLSCMLVCKKWYYSLSDERSDVWRIFCNRKLSKSVVKSPVLSSLGVSYKAKLRAYYYAWDSNECSRNIYIKPNGFTLHRNPVAQSE